MNTFVALEIVIAVETLWALVALERSVRRGGGHAVRWRMAPIKMLRAGDMSTVEPREKPGLHSTHHRHGPTGAVYVGHDGTVHRWERI